MKSHRAAIDVRLRSERRRFYLDRARRKPPVGAGSDLRFLMAIPRREIGVNPHDVFGDLPILIVGGAATRAFSPERHTGDIDLLIEPEHYDEARSRLRAAGFERIGELFFPNSMLGLYGEAWSRADDEVDLNSTTQDLARAAFQGRVEDRTGLRVIPLAFLVLMKLDSARGIDRGDLTRMLGRLDGLDLEQIVQIVSRHSSDSTLVDDIGKYAELGGWEWQDRAPRNSPTQAPRR